MRGVAVLAVVLLARLDNLETNACSSQNSAPTPSQVFSTDDGVRFRVEVVAKGLEIPWSLVFMPDGRLLVPERHGRVRVIDTARGTAEIALTIDDVSTDGEAGLLGLALDPAFTSNRLVYLHYPAPTPGGRPANRALAHRGS